MIVVINGNSGDSRIRRIKPHGDSDVKAQEEQHGRRRVRKSLDTGVCRGEGRW
jgi:hypothetical protein